MPTQLPQDSALHKQGFIYGVATSAFQIEGGYEDRLPCIWDSFCEQPGKIRDQSNGKIACDHIARLEEDLDLLSWLGVDAYRFSISWARLLREDGSVNPPGLAFYERLVDGLQQRGIQAFATLYHWELPSHLEQQGGWLNRETALRFQDYTNHAVRHLGDRVAAWSTLNEPWCSAYLGYGNGYHAPGRTGLGSYRSAGHHLLLAHGLAMGVIRTEAPDSMAGIVLNFSPCDPLSQSPEDVKAAQLADDFHYQWFMGPVMEGQYPDLLHELPEAEKPPVQPGDMALISASIDYLGVNYYTRNRYRAGGRLGFEEVPPEGEVTDMGWEIYPQGLEDLLSRLSGRYQLPPVYICENGVALPDQRSGSTIDDPVRARYLQTHLAALDDALRSGIDVRGYFYWSMMDNFEWAEGYSKRFGLFWVDYQTQERLPKNSAQGFRAYLQHRRAQHSAPPLDAASAVPDLSKQGA